MELITNTIFINLEHRTDRLEHVSEEFKKISEEFKKMNIHENMNIRRFDAIKTDSGNVGCTLSHIKCLEIAKQNAHPFVFICEDDIQFANPAIFLENLRKFHQLHENGLKWDVLIVGGNTCPPFQQINDFCLRAFNVQTTTGYIVQKHYYDTLINNFKDGLQRLIREPHNEKIYSIDIYWKQLQQVHNWFITIPLTVNQYYDYSDIEERVVDYTRAMLDLEKKELLEYLRKQQQTKEMNHKKKMLHF